MASIVIVLQESDAPCREKLSFLAAPVLVSGAIFVTLTGFAKAETTIDFLGWRVFELTVIEHWRPIDFSLLLSSWIDAANAFGIAGAVFIAMCVCVITPNKPPTWSPATATNDKAAVASAMAVVKQEVENAVDDLEARTRWLKYLLFGASAILISAVANVQAWRGWPTEVLNTNLHG